MKLINNNFTSIGGHESNKKGEHMGKTTNEISFGYGGRETNKTVTWQLGFTERSRCL